MDHKFSFFNFNEKVSLECLKNVDPTSTLALKCKIYINRSKTDI